jgi:hypothetical protein
MDGLIEAIGDGIVGLIKGAFDTIGGILRGIVGDVQSIAPMPLLAAVAFVVLAIVAWSLARR